MDPLAWVSKPLDNAQKQLIEKGSLWHYTKREHIDSIVNGGRGQIAPGKVVQVSLSPPNGWSLNLWKLIRDATVWDANLSSVDYMRYMYFFLGKPPDNVKAMNVQNAPYGIEIKGGDLISQCSGRVFMRKIDKVVVVRGSYDGPAIVHA